MTESNQEMYRDSIISELRAFASNPMYDEPDFAGLAPHFTAREVAIAFPSTTPNPRSFDLFHVDENDLEAVARALDFTVDRLKYEDPGIEPAYVFKKIR